MDSTERRVEPDLVWRLWSSEDSEQRPEKYWSEAEVSPLFPPPLIHHQPFLCGPGDWVSPEGHSLWVLLPGKFQLDAELLLDLRDAEERRGGQREVRGSFPVEAEWVSRLPRLLTELPDPVGIRI